MAGRKEYPESYLPVDIIIDDDMIQRISKIIRLRHSDELRKEWGGFERFGGELLLLVEQVDEEIAMEKSAIQEQKKAATAAAKAQQIRLKELTNANASERPSACRTPVFDVPGTGVSQVHLQTPHSLESSSADSSMTSIFSATTWETNGVWPSPALHADTPFTAPDIFAQWHTPVSMKQPATLQANSIESQAIQSPFLHSRPHLHPRPVKKSRVQEVELDDMI